MFFPRSKNLGFCRSSFIIYTDAPNPQLALDEALSALLVKANCAVAKLDWSAGKHPKDGKVYSAIAGGYAKCNV